MIHKNNDHRFTALLVQHILNISLYSSWWGVQDCAAHCAVKYSVVQWRVSLRGSESWGICSTPINSLQIWLYDVIRVFVTEGAEYVVGVGEYWGHNLPSLPCILYSDIPCHLCSLSRYMFSVSCVPRILYPVHCILHVLFCTSYPVPCTLHPTSLILYLVSCILCPASCIPYFVPRTQYPVHSLPRILYSINWPLINILGGFFFIQLVL